VAERPEPAALVAALASAFEGGERRA
jgi:hypothetical protein